MAINMINININNDNSYYQVFDIKGYLEIIWYKTILRPLMIIFSKLNLGNYQNNYIKVHLKNYKFPLYFRHNTSDHDVFYEVFVREQYACVAELLEPKLILDCGANVGYASIYFLERYPNAHVIAIEPDPDNFKLCQKNLSHYGERVSLINSGIWSHQTGLVIKRQEFGEHREWGIQVKESLDDQQADLEAVDIATILQNSDFDTIDLLKIDIEGSEKVVFSHNYESWLNRVKNIAIELHGQSCEQAFFQALSGYDYQLSQSGELTVCQAVVQKNN